MVWTSCQAAVDSYSDCTVGTVDSFGGVVDAVACTVVAVDTAEGKAGRIEAATDGKHNAAACAGGREVQRNHCWLDKPQAGMRHDVGKQPVTPASSRWHWTLLSRLQP